MRLHLLATSLRKQCTLQEKQVKAAAAVTFADEPTTSPEKAANLVKNLSNGMREDTMHYRSLRKDLEKDRRHLFKVENLPKNVKPEETYPSRAKLIRCRAFGKPCISKSYSVEKSFRQCCVILWKMMDDQSCNNLAEALGEEGIAMLKKSRQHRRTDFSALQLLPFDWDIEDDDPAIEKKIMKYKRDLNDACLIHYDMDTEAVQRFCGGRRMNEHRRTLEMMKVTSHIMPTDKYLALGAGIIDGVPNFLYGDVPASELESNIASPNLPSARKNPDILDKAIKKEEKITSQYA